MYLWGYVIRGATERSRCLWRENVLLTHAKVGNFDMTIRINHDIVQLQISDEKSKKEYIGKIQVQRQTYVRFWLDGLVMELHRKCENQVTQTRTAKFTIKFLSIGFPYCFSELCRGKAMVAYTKEERRK